MAGIWISRDAKVKVKTPICFWSQKPNLQNNEYHSPGYLYSEPPAFFERKNGYLLGLGECKEFNERKNKQ